MVLVIAISTESLAISQLYSSSRVRIRCAVLNIGANSSLLGKGSNSNNDVGDIFYTLERSPLKPSGWVLENPISRISASLNNGKANTAYWQVTLTENTDLSRLDVVYLPVTGNSFLNFRQVAQLQKFVDQGGILWIDNASTISNMGPSFLLSNFEFKNKIVTGYDAPANRHHPIISNPYWLTEMDIANLGGGSSSRFYYDQPGGAGEPISFEVMLPIVGVNNNPSIGANTYGSGKIVTTANYIGRGIYRSFRDASNIKFAFNVLYWSSSWSSFRKDIRHSASAIDTLGARNLIPLWSFPVTAPNSTDASPVIYKNVVFYSAGDTLYAFDLMPSQDIDGDGNYNDGDQGFGTYGEDLIWQVSPGGTLSPPSVVTLQDPSDTTKSIESVMVLSSDGNIYFYEAFPMDANRHLLAVSSPVLKKPKNLGGLFSKPSAPIYTNGWVYATGDDGKVYAYNPTIENWNTNTTGTALTSWALPLNNSSEKRGSPVFGYVQNSDSGAVVGMLNWIARWTLGSEPNDYIYGVPITVSQDKIRHSDVNPHVNGETQYQVNYSGAKIATFPYKCTVYIRYSDGNTETVELSKTLADSLKYLNVNGTNGKIIIPRNISRNATVFASYTLSYDPSGTPPPNFIPQPIQPTTANPQPPRPPVKVIGSPVLGSANDLCFNASRKAAKEVGSVNSLLFDATSNSNKVALKTKWMYLFHSGIAMSGLNDSPDGNGIPSAIQYPNQNKVDPWVYPDLYNVTDVIPVGSPVYTTDKIFTAVNGKVNGADCSAIVCLNANPTFTIRIMNNKNPKSLYDSNTGARLSVKLWQPDLVENVGQTDPNVITATEIRPDNASHPKIDYDRGEITFEMFDGAKVKNSTGSYTNLFTPSLPVWVFLNNTLVPMDWSTWEPMRYKPGKDAYNNYSDPQNPKDPNGYLPRLATAGDVVDMSNWNSMLWYYPVPNNEVITSSPVVIGNTVYFNTDKGNLYALDAQTGKNAEAILSGLTPVMMKDPTPPGGNATSALRTDSSTSAAAANGVLVVPTDGTLQAFANVGTLVADHNRLLEVGGDGEIMWSIDSLRISVSTPELSTRRPGTKSVPINDPATAKYTSEGTVLLVNTGSNMVSLLDKSGTVGFAEFANDMYISWNYQRFNDYSNFLRPGQSQELQTPTDAIMWQQIENNLLVTHMLIADSGNGRIVDLTYRLDPTNGELKHIDGTPYGAADVDPASGFVFPDLNWVSRTDSNARRLTFNSIQVVPDYSDPTRQQIWAAVPNYSAGGAIVSLNYRDTPANWRYYWTDVADASYLPGAITTYLSGGKQIPLAISKVESYNLTSPKFIRVNDYLPGNQGERIVFVCDKNGIYRTEYNSATHDLTLRGPGTGNDAAINTVLLSETYMSINRDLKDPATAKLIGVPLQPSSVEQLPNGKWLVTNSFSNVDKAGTKNFRGEVFEYDPLKAGNPPIDKITWSFPRIEWKAISATAWDWDQVINNSYIPRQPVSAVRRY